MLYRLVKHLFDPNPAEGGGGTPAASTPAKSTPAPTPKEPKMVRVDTPKAVPENVKKMEFSIDSFDPIQPSGHGETGNRTTKEVLQGKEAKVEPVVKPAQESEKKAEPEKKVEPESVLKPPTEKPRDEKGQFKPSKEKVEPVTVPGQQQGQDPINYADFTTDQQKYLKQMSNEAKVFVADVVKQNKELKKLEGGSYLQHDLAYTLDPKYNEYRTEIHFASKESNYWRDQLVLLSQGKPIKNLNGWDKNGQPVLGQEFQPTKELEEDVRKLMIKSDGVAQQKQQELGQFSQQYKQRVSQDLHGIEEEMKKRFSWEADPKLLEYKLPIQYEDGERDVPLKQIKDEFVGMFPPYLRQNIGVRIAASMMIALRIGHAELARLKGTQQVQQIQQQEQQRGEPTSEVRPNKPDLKEVNGIKEFSLSAI